MNKETEKGVLVGMELAMRICRNRAQDCRDTNQNWQEAQNCAGIIRCVQVEIGSGRQAIPQLTLEEQDEINRIA